jgi:hypothetical protein
MLLIDRSGSLGFPANDQVAPCTPGCNTTGHPACVPDCPTRLQELRKGFAGFFASGVAKARLGLAIFPTAAPGGDNECSETAPGDILVPLSTTPADLEGELVAAAASVDARIQAMTFAGGTPTGRSLGFLRGYPPLLDPDPAFARDDYVLLVTDGLPNCNQSNPHTCANLIDCKCTLFPSTSCEPSSYCTTGCLDADASTSETTKLRSRGIKTIVVGFGAETAGGRGPATLNAMAEAGGFLRRCPGGSDAECGINNTCNKPGGLCRSQILPGDQRVRAAGGAARHLQCSLTSAKRRHHAPAGTSNPPMPIAQPIEYRALSSHRG